MALADTIVAASAGLIGACIGAWSTSWAARSGSRRSEITAAQAELAGVPELLSPNDTYERRARMSMLRYRVAQVGANPQDVSQLMAAIEKVHNEWREYVWNVEEGNISKDEGGVDTRLMNAAIEAADKIALGLHT